MQWLGVFGFRGAGFLELGGVGLLGFSGLGV